MAKDDRQQARQQLRQPRLADIVAKSLRAKIISGELADGASVPTLDGLVHEFGVSAPSVREALRILENEGLISVRRGSVGGAVVHGPKASSAAYMLGIVLQAREVSVADLEIALTGLEPLCASFCAQRSDRLQTVVPELQKSCDEARAAIDDPEQFGRAMRRFHRLFGKRCGNETLTVMMGALEWLWGLQPDTWAYRIAYTDEAPDADLRATGLRSHQEIIEAIAEGDAELVARLVREHAVTPDVYATTNMSVIHMADAVPGTADPPPMADSDDLPLVPD